MDYLSKYKQWLEGDAFDQETKKELQKLAGNDKEIEDRFYKDLEFGTAGIRGVIGAGTNRMNQYTVSKATQGLANYILKQGQDAAKRGVVIAYDSRNQSPEFAEYAALVLNANGIKAYVFESLRPTPELSFAIRHLNCTAGIVITASHNPPEYNGFKCYWEDGAQVPYPRDEAIMAEVNQIQDLTAVAHADKAASVKNGMLIYIGKAVDDAYEAAVKDCMLSPEVIQKTADALTVVYTPLHGTGLIPVKRILEDIGFKHVYVVPEQAEPDPMFSTVGYPNPEDPKVFKLAMKLAEEKNADLIIGTDPDADRVGVVVKNNAGEYVVLTGNMTGALLTEYILSTRKEKGLLPHNGVVIKTIVSTELIDAITEAYGVTLMNVLTGFKYIGEKIKNFEADGDYQFLFGMEESYGCLPGTYARDKDAVAATSLICELAASLKQRGKTMYEGLLELYEKYGYYKEDVRSLTLQGIEGLSKISAIMSGLRDQPIQKLADLKVERIEDYQKREALELQTGQKTPIQLPESNVLRYTLEGGLWCCVRPSGTEPKIKIYFGAKGASMAEAEGIIQKVGDALMAIVNQY